MKKYILIAAVALGLGATSVTANAQAVEQPGFLENWSLGVDGGVTTPLDHSPFWRSMRGNFGLEVRKQVTPTFGLGVEGQFGVNTSSWKNRIHSDTGIDNMYLGTFGTVDLFNLFGGYPCKTRRFTIEAMAGAGWGHYFQNQVIAQNRDWNFFATKVGLNFNINCSDHLTVAIKPAIVWNMNRGQASSNQYYPEVYEGSDALSETYYNANRATFDLQAAVIWHMSGNNFRCLSSYNQGEIDALNAQINDLRAALEACLINTAAWEAKAAGLADELAACLSREPEVVVKEVDNSYLQSVRYVFFKIGSSVITNDQMPNVEMIADYLKNHPEASVEVKGYASKDGPLDLNIKLAEARAQAVKTALINKYGIKADRIKAEGQGIGEMFKEESWNRVSICTIQTAE